MYITNKIKSVSNIIWSQKGTENWKNLSEKI